MGFVDGFNLYFGLREAGYGSLRWLDVSKLVANLCQSRQSFVGAQYFTARINGPGAKHDRQKALLEAYDTLPDCKVHFGHFQANVTSCRSCGKPWKQAKEKMTDVNIAVEMLSAAFLNEFDTALLISGDSDLAPAVEKTINLFGKRVVIAFPPSRYSTHLGASASAYIQIRKAQLARSQLAETITKLDGHVLKRPPSWA
jgi:uncharacterized LabA/DUF88 family protein